MKLNHSLKFSTSKGPVLSEFTLGYVHAACEDLDEYAEFSNKSAEVSDLSHMSIIMMRDESTRMYEKLKTQFEKAQNYNHISMEQLGHDLWLATNNKKTSYISKLPKDIKESILKTLIENCQPCELTKKDGNFVMQFKDEDFNSNKNKEYSETYKSLTINGDSAELKTKIINLQNNFDKKTNNIVIPNLKP